MGRVEEGGDKPYPERQIHIFFRSRTHVYGYEKITGTGENSKEYTEYGNDVFWNRQLGIDLDIDCFLKRMYGCWKRDITSDEY